MVSPSPSDRKPSSARDTASRSAPAWLDRPPPLTVHSRSKRPSTPMNCSGNISCSLRGGVIKSACYLTDSGIAGFANSRSGWVTFLDKQRKAFFYNLTTTYYSVTSDSAAAAGGCVCLYCVYVCVLDGVAG